MATHLRSASIGSLAVGSEQITATGQYYRAALDERFKGELAGSQFETSATAHWEPYPGSTVEGHVTVGVEPPPDRDIRTRELTVPSGFEAVRGDAVTAVEEGGGYAAIAMIVAEATIDGYLPPVESKHALERDDSVTMLTQYRYERLARLLDEADAETIREQIERTDADPAEANQELTAALAAELEPELRQRFENPRAAAESVSTGTVSITVRTWDP
jgi:hypothetical protein